MLAELLEQDHGQQVGARKAAWRHMERRGGLRDPLALPAGELLAHRFEKRRQILNAGLTSDATFRRLAPKVGA